jgi:hypothetical protein
VSTVRRALLNARYERLDVRVGGPDASMKGQWPTLLLAAVVVFACFFAIGRLGAGGASHDEPSSALRVFSGRAAIPGALRGDSPISGSVPSAIAPSPARSTAVSPSGGASGAQSQPLAENTSRASVPSSSTQAAPVVQPAPVKASAPVTASPQSPQPSSAGRPSSSGGGAHPSSPSGGSFDSSE